MRKTPSQIRQEKLLQEKEELDRFFNRNIAAMSFCNSKGLTIYASSQAHSGSFVKLFVQKGEAFKPLNNIEYDQNEQKDVVKYVAAIDREYERLYLKMKDRA